MANGPLLGEIRIMAFDFAPPGWVQCNGQFLPIAQNLALFGLIGTTFGGDGKTTFQLPDLQGRVPISFNKPHPVGQKGGEAAHTVSVAEMGGHKHALMTDAVTPGTMNTQTPSSSTVLGQDAGVITPPGSFSVSMYSDGAPGGALDPHSLTTTGSSQPHENMQPYLALTFCLALQGAMPLMP
jgi:microcystin-dependent protein